MVGGFELLLDAAVLLHGVRVVRQGVVGPPPDPSERTRQAERRRKESGKGLKCEIRAPPSRGPLLSVNKPMAGRAGGQKRDPLSGHCFGEAVADHLMDQSLQGVFGDP
jgi:hypothetical protein